jgi:hypothetical protein
MALAVLAAVDEAAAVGCSGSCACQLHALELDVDAHSWICSDTRYTSCPELIDVLYLQCKGVEILENLEVRCARCAVGMA